MYFVYGAYHPVLWTRSLTDVSTGFYCLLFGIAVRTLLRHRSQEKDVNFSLQLTWVVLLFLVSTLFVILESWGMIRQSIIEYKAARSRDYETLFRFLSGDVGNDTWLYVVFSSSFWIFD